MSRKFLYTIIFTLALGFITYGQPGRPEPPRGGGPPKGEWMLGIDANADGRIDNTEFQSAISRTFAEIDRNGDGTLQAAELPDRHEKRPGGPPPGAQEPGRPRPPRGEGPRGNLLPPFFFMEAGKDGPNITRADFERTAKAIFAEMDKNGDGQLDREEARPPRRPEGPPPPPNAKFVAAELRFGDKLVRNQPFSAEILIEDTRRLYDGTTVTKRSTGAIYRDASGRTRREQPLEMVGGFSVVGTDNRPQMLVFINDFATRTQYFLDVNNKIARRHPLGGNPPDPPTPTDAKNESLGTKVIEGVSCEGTRVSFEIPSGHLGNDKPIKVVTENWFSPELQMLVLSRHVDPLAGEHVFKLTNIRRTEPAAELFTVPTGYRVMGHGPKE